MRLRKIAVASLIATATLAAAAAPAADAKLPSPSSKKIVPGRSIAGVKLGMDAKAAVEKWGAGSNCEVTIGSACTWSGTMRQGRARFTVESGKVASVTVEAGQKVNYEPAYSRPLTTWKTSKRIGLGAALRKVKRAYPKAKPSGGGLTLTSGASRTIFQSSLGRTASISIDRGED